MKSRISMSQRELDRADVVRRLIRGELNGTKAATLLGLSVRQVRRLKAAFRKCGSAALVHGNRGRRSNHRLPIKEGRQIVQVVAKRYRDFTPTFAAEKLRELHHIDRDPKTIERILVDAGIWEKRKARKKEVHRAWRARRSCIGELIQFDGSYHHWLEDRESTGELCLLAAIDDATSQVTFARFAEHEGVLPVFAFWQDYLVAMGKPTAIYMDKFSTYKMNAAVAKDNPDLRTQFERAMATLRIEPIFANSPQAKGRVERLFRTLQDRLVKELRLHKISTVTEANRYLADAFVPDFNLRFSVVPASTINMHRVLTLSEQKRLPSILSRQEARTLHNDYTVAYKKSWYQLLPTPLVALCKGDTITIEEHTDGSLHFTSHNRSLCYALLPARPQKGLLSVPWVLTPPRIPHKPGPNHPWRRSIHAEATRTSHSP